MRPMLLLTLLLPVVMGCSKKVNEFSQDVAFVTIAKGVLYGNGTENIVKGNVVISSQIDFNNLIVKMEKVNNLPDIFVEKEIDFSKYQVIAVFDDVKPFGPSSIEVVKIVKNKNHIKVFISETAIRDGQVINQPYHIVRIPKCEKEIVFKERERVM